MPREFCCSWSYKRYFVLIVSPLCTQPFCFRKGRTKPQHFFSVQSQINFKFTHILIFFVKWCLCPLYYFYEVPMLRGDYFPEQGDGALWWNHDQTVLDLGAIIWLGFVSCTPGWSGWSQGMLCSRSFPQVEQPCVIFLYLVHRAAGKFIPVRQAGEQGILESSCSWGIPQSSQAALVAALRGSNLCHHWKDDDGESGMTSGKMERPSQCGSSTPEGIARAELKITVFPMESVSSL